jgi:hypothetical protein
MDERARTKNGMSKSDITYNEWRKALEEVRLESKQLVPEGWINKTDYAALGNIKVTTAKEQLKMLYDSGRAERQKINGMFYYKLNKK